MAKKRMSMQSPVSLTMNLFAPGMSPLHRAGLGGLAATLNYIEYAWQRGILLEDQLPGSPWQNGPPWVIEPTRLTLQFGAPEAAREFLKRLFKIAFDLKDGLIFLPGQYPEIPPPLEVRALLQQGMLSTFLQHVKAKTLASEEKDVSYSVNVSNGKSAEIHVTFEECTFYKHQKGWEELTENDGCLKTKPIEVASAFNPGAIVRHNAFHSTEIKQDAGLVLPLYFALVGCLTFPIPSGGGVLLVPKVDDLQHFANVRPLMTPTTAQECRIASAADAALQVQVRLKGIALANASQIPGFLATTFQSVPWSPQQKTRVAAIDVSGRQPENCGDLKILEHFEIAMQELSPRVVVRKNSETTGKKKKRNQKSPSDVVFWSDSLVRPLIADNLVRNRPWYAGFTKLMIAADPQNNQPLRERLRFEKKGILAMIERISQSTAETALIHAVHEALKRRYGQIKSENEGNPVAMKNRWQGEYDRWRLAFAGAKTADQIRRALCDLFSRAGVNSVLQSNWQNILPMLDANRWQLTRDLALLALASYSGSGSEETSNPEHDANSQENNMEVSPHGVDSGIEDR